jgi:hypothetical protein
VSQVSIVAALRRANPTLGARQLYAEATHVGRDHVASAVNTLALAYAGASLPLLLFFAQGNQPVGRLLTGELVAVEIVRMLVGSIGLVLSVPVTTRLAALVLSHVDPDELPDDDGHGHGHGGGPGPHHGALDELADLPRFGDDARRTSRPRRPATADYDWRQPGSQPSPPGPTEPWF